MHRSYEFTHAICRTPGDSASGGIRSGHSPDPDPALFRSQHAAYIEVLKQAGVSVTVLPALEAYPDSVFVEDPVLMISDTAIILRPGAASRLGEADAMRRALTEQVSTIIELPGQASIDGGDILLADDLALVGLSNRTQAAAVDALAELLSEFGYRTKVVTTPPDILHFKSDCGLVSEDTIFASPRLSRLDAFQDFKVITTPDGEEAAANIIRVNRSVIMNTGFPASRRLLLDAGYDVATVDTSMAARLDGGLSCMSLRYSKSDSSS